MLSYEVETWSKGVKLIAGIDEVGRGCLFGDVIAASVVFEPGLQIEGVKDSKKLTMKQREELYDIIHEKALAIGIGRIDAQLIDQINIKQASRLAMKQAVESMALKPEMLFIDAERIDLPIPQLSLIKGDSLSHSIAAASIVAKVTRDRLCEEWDTKYPDYGIAQHKGYPTKLHRERIIQHGPSQLHRKTFLNKILQQSLFDPVE